MNRTTGLLVKIFKMACFWRTHASAIAKNKATEIARTGAIASRRHFRFKPNPPRGPKPNRARLAELAATKAKPGFKGVLWTAVHAGHAGVGATKCEALGRLRGYLHESRTAV
jgi:hypothetical protein